MHGERQTPKSPHPRLAECVFVLSQLWKCARVAQTLAMTAALVLSWLNLVGSASGANSEISEAEFGFHGKPIHPLVIKQFEPWISDARPPITVELNLTAAWDSNQYAAGFKTDSNGVNSISLPEGETYSYRRLGRLADGTYVLRSFYSGGGSGVFEALLFVQSHTRVTYLADGVHQDKQVFLQVVRRFPLGDRDGADVVIQPHRVIVGKSRYRDHSVTLEFPNYKRSQDTQ